MPEHVLVNAKAYAALVGAITASLLTQFGPDGNVGAVLTVVSIVAAAVVTWRVPNAE